MKTLREIGKQKNNFKKSMIFILLTTFIISILIFFGIKMLVYTISFLSDFKRSSTMQNNSDTLPPKIPYIYSYDQYTNYQKHIIKGEAEPSSTVYLYLNNNISEKIADSDGKFLFEINLSEGNNEFYLYSKDSSGNTSAKTKLFTIIKDTIKPTLTINQPANNSTFGGINNRLLEIKGSTEKDVELKISEKFVNINENGDFIYKIDLKVGENIISILAKDRAGNETVKELSVIYQN
jgi:hypothetical protein